MEFAYFSADFLRVKGFHLRIWVGKYTARRVRGNFIRLIKIENTCRETFTMQILWKLWLCPRHPVILTDVTAAWYICFLEGPKLTTSPGLDVQGPCEDLTQSMANLWAPWGAPYLVVKKITGWWCQIFFMFIPTWGRFPFWLILFKWVETTNQISLHFIVCSFGCGRLGELCLKRRRVKRCRNR